MLDASVVADLIAADNADFPVWTARFETRSHGDAQLLIAGLTAAGISATPDGSTQIIYAVFKPGEQAAVARFAGAAWATYLHPERTRRVPR